jgi:hypothetical protein
VLPRLEAAYNNEHCLKCGATLNFKPYTLNPLGDKECLFVESINQAIYFTKLFATRADIFTSK